MSSAAPCHAGHVGPFNPSGTFGIYHCLGCGELTTNSSSRTVRAHGAEMRTVSPLYTPPFTAATPGRIHVPSFRVVVVLITAVGLIALAFMKLWGN